MRLLFLLTLTLASLPALAWNTPTFTGSNKYTAWTWTGAAHDNNFDNGANWCGAFVNGACRGQSSKPPTNATVVFNDACVGVDCNVNLASSVIVRAWLMQPSYSGSVAAGTYDVEIRYGGFRQDAGTFNAGSGAFKVCVSTATCDTPDFVFRLTGGTFNGSTGPITIGNDDLNGGGYYLLSGGSFKASSGVTYFGGTYFDASGLGSFNANGGQLFFETPNHTSAVFQINLASISPNDLRFRSTSGHDLVLNSDTTVTGNLIIGSSTSSTAALRGTGSITVTNGNLSLVGYSMPGSLKIIFTGSGLQEITTATANAGADRIPQIILRKTTIGANLKFTGYVEITGGFEALTATSSGNIDFTGANVAFSSYSSTQLSNFNTDFIFPTLELSGAGQYMIVQNVVVSGDLKLTYNTGSYANSSDIGFIKVGGNINATAGSFGSKLHTIELNGTGTQTVDTGGSLYNTLPGIRINKPSGAVEFKNSVNGIARVFGNFEFAVNGISASAVTMPTVTDFTLGNTNTTITSNGVEFPSNTTVRFYANGNGAAIYLADDMTVRGNLEQSTNGTYAPVLTSTTGTRYLKLYGSLACTLTSKGLASDSASPALVQLYGTNPQVNYSTTATNTWLPNLEFRNSGAAVLSAANEVQTKGFRQAGAGTIDATAMPIRLNVSGTPTIYPGNAIFGAFAFENNSSVVINSGETLNVLGALVYQSNVTTRQVTGTINVAGNVSSVGTPTGGTATVTMTGANSTWSRVATQPSGLITIAKTAGQRITLGSNVTLTSGQSINVTSGSVDLAAFNMTVSGSGTLTLAPGTTLKLNGGILTVNGAVVSPGPYNGGGDVVL